MAETPDLPDHDPSDEEWLAALAGRDASTVLPTDAYRQGASLRAAIQAESQAAMADIPPVDELSRRRLLQRLREEGVLPAVNTATAAEIADIAAHEPAPQASLEASLPSNREVVNKDSKVVPLKARTSTPRRYTSIAPWAAAASVVLAVGLGLQLSRTDWTEGEVTRGGAALIVENPAETADKLIAGLRGVRSEPTVYRWCNGRVDLKAPATNDALNFLVDDPWRLLPDVHGQQLHLTLTPVREAKCSIVGLARDRSHRLVMNIRWWLSDRRDSAANTESTQDE